MRATPLPRVSRRGKVTLAVVGAAIVLLIFLNQIVGLWTDWLWYQEVGYTSVFTGVISTKIWLFLIFGLIVGGFVGGNLYLAFRLRPFLRGGSPEQQALERYRLLFSPRMPLWTGLVGGVIGLFAGLSGQAHWQQWMLFRNRVDFGATDPHFGTDIGFYVFDLPFWRYLLDVGFTMTALAVIGALAVHYLYGGVRLQGGGDRMTVAARAHLTALVALFVLVKAAAYFLDRRSLLVQENRGTGTWGAGYTDINAVLPAKEILAYISIVVAIAILVFSNARMRNLLWAGAALALLGVSAVAIGGVYPLIVEQFTVKPNRPVREAPYIEYSIAGTRAAFGIADVKREQFVTQNETAPASLATDTTVVPTIRLLDPAVVNETYTQYQQIRGFYDFPEKLDVDRYVVDGKLQDFVVGVRELNYSALTDQQTNWQNRHTVFTHGYGFVAAPANNICDGAPFFVSGLITASDTNEEAHRCVAPADTIVVNQPRIYYGELVGDGDYVIVGKAPGGVDAEYDRPQGASQASYSYTGAGGVDISSLGRRILYGLHFWEQNFLLFDGFNENSKILYIRDPRERVERVAPFLTLDGDPYPAVIDGRVVWILDGYTTSSTYPYSQQVDLRAATSDAQTDRGTTAQDRQNVNYMRNSVKATVDAYDGTVTLYEFDTTDPVLKAWNQAFGGIVKSRSEIPAELAAHFRYPEDLFKVQRDLLSRYHVSDGQEFNNGSDFWDVPADPASSSTTGTAGGLQPPYYLLTQFPGVTESRFQLTAALTPRGRQNLAALLSGVVTPEGLKLEMLELPREGRIPGPGQAQQLMVNDNAARSQITLLSGQGENAADVVYGNLLSLPYGGGLLYVQPVYLKSKGANAYPLMRQVLVSYGTSNVAFAPTLTEAIKKLVAQGQEDPGDGDGDGNGNGNGNGNEEPPPPPPPGNGGGEISADLAAALARLDAAIQAVEAAQRSGDFEAYGRALAELQAAMDAVQAARNASSTSPSASPTPSP